MRERGRGRGRAMAAAAVGLVAAGAAGEAGALTARDRTAELGIRVDAITQGRNPAADLTGDGIPDLLVNRHNGGPTTLFRGLRGGGYAAQQVLPNDDRHGAAVGDFRGPGGGPPDGRPDFFYTLGSCSGRGPEACGGRVFHRELWVNLGGGAFRDEGIGSGADHPSDRGRDVIAADLDRDGDRDLATAAEGNPAGTSLNRVYRNDGGRFREVTGTPVRRQAGSECLAALPKTDGSPSDLLYCADPATAAQPGLLHFRNDGGWSFREVTAGTAYRGLRARDLEVGDVTGDGRADLVVTTAGAVEVWAGDGAGGLPERLLRRPVTDGFDSVLCDVDRDGDRDLYVATGRAGGRNAADVLLLNAARGRAWSTFAGLPQAAAGGGDEATCVQDRPGGPAILVANGRWTTPGPYQVIVFSR